MMRVLSACAILLSITLPGASADARLRVVQGKDGPILRYRGVSVPLSAVENGPRLLGPYALSKQAQTGTFEAKRSWSFGKTRASHTRSYNADGSLFGYNRSTGSVVPGHTLRVKGKNTEQGRYDWTTRTTKSFQILVEGTNSKGPLESCSMVSGPMGTFSKHVYRDGRPTEHTFKPLGVQRLALPAPAAR